MFWYVGYDIAFPFTLPAFTPTRLFICCYYLWAGPSLHRPIHPRTHYIDLYHTLPLLHTLLVFVLVHTYTFPTTLTHCPTHGPRTTFVRIWSRYVTVYYGTLRCYNFRLLLFYITTLLFSLLAVTTLLRFVRYGVVGFYDRCCSIHVDLPLCPLRYVRSVLHSFYHGILTFSFTFFTVSSTRFVVTSLPTRPYVTFT